MPMIMSSFLIIILLYFSLHATHVVFLAKKPDAHAYHQIPSKDVDDEMINHREFSIESEAKASLSKELRPEQGGSGRDGGHQDAVDESSRQYQKPDSGANLPSRSITTTEESKGSISGEVRSDPVVSVSSKANINNDHKRNWEHRPGFNLDYLPPRTHPPSHN